MSKTWIDFQEIRTDRRTKIFKLYNKDIGWFIGTIEWDTGWRPYIFSSSPDTKLAKSCLDDISAFIEKLMEARNGTKI